MSGSSSTIRMRVSMSAPSTACLSVERQENQHDLPSVRVELLGDLSAVHLDQLLRDSPFDARFRGAKERRRRDFRRHRQSDLEAGELVASGVAQRNAQRAARLQVLVDVMKGYAERLRHP